ncbi:hypothetical protein [Butyrivibrio sp. AC2005]|uniref:hypothetical protein n=1 Tax=Butyrivibrio sp. AC2005 TaxID=1280672 RepID=UPI0004043F3A|nr:hypothetical protein [Butyrivibrio sp. AC2005]
MGFINEKIAIDFEIPKDIIPTVEICEELSKQNNWGYDEYADFLIDNLCKEAYRQGHITKKQWDALAERYLSYPEDN